MGFLRRRSREKKEQPVYEEITITLSGLSSAKLRLAAMIERHGEEHPESVEAMQQVAYHLSQEAVSMGECITGI